MAAPGRHVGHYVQKNGKFLFCNVEQLLSQRSFGWTAALRQQAAEANKESTETVVIPRKKSWSKEAVLEALATTISRDATAYPYHFQDDPYLYPRNSFQIKMFSLSQESGRAAAKYFINNNPKFFTKDFAEPHIPCLMPETVSLHLEDVSEEALKERIKLRRSAAAVDMYDQLLQAGTVVSLDATHDLLDLVCFYSDGDPLQEGEPQTEDTESPQEELKRRKSKGMKRSTLTWRENNDAERIFNLMPERGTRCYSALIRGMVKHGAFTKAFDTYTDMLNNRVTGDVHIFNALIIAAPNVREKYQEKWELITELLNQMNQQKIHPNLLTFNSVLKSLKRCGPLARGQSLNTLSEMKALRIAPSLATFSHILSIFYKAGEGYTDRKSDILQEVMSELEGTSFTCQDPDDVQFFASAMKICFTYKDLEMGYKLQSLLEVGENWKLLGFYPQQRFYYSRFFSLLCMLEHLDNTLKWYRQNVPSKYCPDIQGVKDLLQAVDTESRLDLLPGIWKDIKSLDHDAKLYPADELLSLMARDTHSPELQQSFAAIALDLYEERSSLDLKANSLSHITTLLLRANMTEKAWEMLPIFKLKNRVPTDELLNDFLSVLLRDGASQKAVMLVQLSATFCLPTTPELAKKTLAGFDLTEEQRAILSDLGAAGEHRSE
ncbi:small ribosomal subunit protein mS39 [Parambassis ranga]|uniref:Small ribosomal subunit protein mS39 n=1 Tax=Parambassis ranga TaxID=210632 RepID=A0A6P7J5A3_9TELE|nr:pentatricopeptide repeat domain-containing protein 3, mitochondrial [Parambassis ranga]